MTTPAEVEAVARAMCPYPRCQYAPICNQEKTCWAQPARPAMDAARRKEG